MSDLRFTLTAWQEYIDWLSEDKKTIKRINRLIKSIFSDGVISGEGKPEKLKYRADEYSRRIDQANRLVYKVFEDGSVEIQSCKGHY